MTMTADQIIDRRRLRAKLMFWRVAGFLLLAGLVAALAAAGGAFERLAKRSGDHIARVEISGIITDDREMVKLLRELGEKEQVKAVLLDLSSPGGSTVGGEAIYEAVRDLAGKKPVVTAVGTLAASAGYMIACATDHIVTRRSSLVGSIGVYIQYGDAVELLDKIGVNVETAKSSPLKGEPSPFTPSTDEVRRMLQQVVDDSYQWFIALVAERRGMEIARARALADGSIYTGAQGVENGLVDAIGDEETARKWLVSNRKIGDELEFVDWEPGDAGSAGVAGFDSLADLPGQGLLHAIGRELGAGLLDRLERRLFLDGLSSLMQTPRAGFSTERR